MAVLFLLQALKKEKKRKEKALKSPQCAFQKKMLLPTISQNLSHLHRTFTRLRLFVVKHVHKRIFNKINLQNYVYLNN